jgi:hypothetical protein
MVPEPRSWVQLLRPRNFLMRQIQPGRALLRTTNPHSRAQREGEHIEKRASAGGLPRLDCAPQNEQDRLNSAGKATHKPVNRTAAGTTAPPASARTHTPRTNAHTWGPTGSVPQRPGSRHRQPDLEHGRLGTQWRGGVRPEKEGEYGEKKKGGKASVREASCAAPTLAVATSQPTTVVAAQLRRKGATGRRRWSPSDRSSLLDCVLAYVNKAAVCSQGKRCAVQVSDFCGLGFS